MSLKAVIPEKVPSWYERGTGLLVMGEQLDVNTKKYPDKLAVKDWRGKAFTYKEFNERVNRLANALLDLGLEKGDRISPMMLNCEEYAEIYCAAARAGLVVAPISWRYVAKEVEYIVDHADSKAVIVEEEFIPVVNQAKASFKKVMRDGYIALRRSDKPVPNGYLDYEELIAKATPDRPRVKVEPKDPWIQVYTSGTTGLPKGCVRSHGSYAALYMVFAIDHGFDESMCGMTIMPWFHVNSTFYGLLWLYIGGSQFIGRDRGFNPEELLQIVDREKVNFISLIPTHYKLLLDLPDEVKRKYDVSSLKVLLTSSAPVRGPIKEQILKWMPHVKLLEAYGSTEAGIVTILKHEDQLRKVGSIGRETINTYEIKLVDDEGNVITEPNVVGELYSRGPMMFDGYYKDPEKTKKSFRIIDGDLYFSAGDMARRDEEGYLYLVDRKDNMIITGGEKVFPSEVEAVIGQHPDVVEVCVVGLPDEKWGEAVTAVVVPREGRKLTEKDVIDWCTGKMAGFKKPKKVVFVKAEELPRTGSGKIIHRKVKEKLLKELSLG
ncbi:MAG: class I adenylate-forming enzyme family protein [Candidatus Nezhaarchaeales archaeon]